MVDYASSSIAEVVAEQVDGGGAQGRKRTVFANPAVVLQSWYVAARSKELRPGQVISRELLNRRIALYRDAQGKAYALDARCPHIGADFRHGTVVGDEVQCAFHHWRFGPDGMCRAAPGLSEVPRRHVRAYPLEERWGLVWLFNGPRPLFPLPNTPPNERLRCISLPSLTLPCHPHLVLANSLDGSHFETLHDLRFSVPPSLEVAPPYRLTLTLQGKPRSLWRRLGSGSGRTDIVTTFTTIGASLAWTTISAPMRAHVVFAGMPIAGGGCRTKTLLFVPVDASPLQIAQTAILLFVLLKDDQRLLGDIAFFPGFTAADSAMSAFAQIVNTLEVW